MKRLLLSTALLFAGCSNGDIAGGTGTETTNGIVVITSTGTPAANGTVYTIDPTHWYSAVSNNSSPVEDSVTIPADGEIFSDAIPENRTYQIRWADESAVVSENLDTIRLKPNRTVRGTAPIGSRVFIGGTAFQAEVQGDSFTIEGVPNGTYSLWVEESDLRQAENRISVEESTTIPELKTSNSLLFEDFADGFSNNPLATVSTGVQWYMVTDTESKVLKNGDWNETTLSETGNSTIDASERDGSVYVEGFLGNDAMYTYLCLGVSLFGESYQTGYNLAQMDSIYLKIRGNGVLDVALETELMDSLGVSHYRSEIVLEENWTEVAIPVSDLKLLASDSAYEISHPWTTASQNVKRLEFLWRSPNNSVLQNYWMEIDEIRFGKIQFPF